MSFWRLQNPRDEVFVHSLSPVASGRPVPGSPVGHFEVVLEWINKMIINSQFSVSAKPAPLPSLYHLIKLLTPPVCLLFESKVCSFSAKIRNPSPRFCQDTTRTFLKPVNNKSLFTFLIISMISLLLACCANSIGFPLAESLNPLSEVSAPFSRSSFTTSKLPFMTARWRGVSQVPMPLVYLKQADGNNYYFQKSFFYSAQRVY